MFTINFVHICKQNIGTTFFCKQFSLSKQKGVFLQIFLYKIFKFSWFSKSFVAFISKHHGSKSNLRLILKLSYLKWKVNIKKMYDKLWKSTLDLVPDWQLKFPKIEEKTLHFYAPFDASLKEQVCSKRNKTRPSVQINDYWVNPNWHELWKQEKCSSLAPPRDIV